MRRESWTSLIPKYEKYAYTQEVGWFIERITDELQPLAVILFGSLARGDYHHASDADFCVILPETPSPPFAGHDRATACDPSGVVQPLVYGVDLFLAMVRSANGLALEVMEDGIFLSGDEEFRIKIGRLHEDTKLRLGIERTTTGWLIRNIG